MLGENWEIPALLLTAKDTRSSWQAYSLRSNGTKGLAWAMYTIIVCIKQKVGVTVLKVYISYLICCYLWPPNDNHGNLEPGYCYKPFVYSLSSLWLQLQSVNKKKIQCIPFQCVYHYTWFTMAHNIPSYYVYTVLENLLPETLVTMECATS